MARAAGGAALQRLFPDASPALLALLDTARGPLQPPIRSEIFGPQRFAQHGRSLGETHRAARALRRATAFRPRLRSNIEVLREAHQSIGQQAASGHDISPAAEWLLDNFHIIEAQLQAIHDELPRRYFRGLPVLLDEPLAGLPRIYGVAWAFVAHTDGAFDEALLVQFLGAYQETRDLTLSELWALPTTLRLVLVDNLRRLAERVAANKAARELANRCCDQIEHWPVAALDELRALMDERGVGRVLLTQMAHRLRHERDPASAEAQAWLSRALPDLAEAQTQQSADQTADNLSVSNAVSSLRDLGDADWLDIVARSSVLMHLMLALPVFAAEHAQTRDQTLHAIEALARRARTSEVAVARVLLALMQAESSEHDPVARSLPSHWLRGRGRPALMQALGLPDGLTRLARGVARRALLPLYLGSLLLGSLGLVAALMHQPAVPAAWASLSPGLLTAGWLALGLMMLWPASEAVVALINRLISESTRPRPLPRLALPHGIPAAHRVLVVIPAFLGSADAIDALLHRLLLHHLANPETQAQFALLSDWPDAAQAHTDADAGLLDHARHRIRALNAAHPWPADAGHAPAAHRFVLLHRPRRFSVGEQRWIGWERKRGKIEQLLHTLATGDASAFLDLGQDARLLADIRYLVTLDSDTELPPGRLRELVGVAAHPHNQPRLDTSGRRVLGGHAILQPRLVTPLPAPAELTAFHQLFAGQCGVDPYSAASSEVYQDLFGQGSFSGKGLLHVAAAHAVLSGRLPPDQVLSHDLLEGALARCATVSDITLIEDAPFHADVAAARLHRWTRGDWQLLPFLLQPRRYPLSGIDRWKLLDNLRRSLVAPLSLAVLWLALAGIGAAPLPLLALVLAAFSVGPLLGAVAGLLPGRRHLAWRRFFRAAGADLLRAMGGGFWHLALLLQASLLSVDAIGRALYRRFVSHRGLLQWTTAAATQAATSTRLGPVLNRHRTEPAVAGLMLAGLWLAGSPHLGLSVALCALWGGSPLWTWWASRPAGASASPALPDAEKAWLLALAHDTWRLFERTVTAEDHHLPPDNLQTSPFDMLAHRTSPTNIGLYLLSVACARAFGWIGTEAMLARMEATLATLQGLHRHHGHFLNWYDTQSGQPLLPHYVSTVDSGNLCGHLLAAAEACREHAAAPGTDAAWGPRLQALAVAFDALAWAPDFSFLYHRKRHLFHIGYRVAEQQLDTSYYDLLASESRLTSLLAIAKGDVPVRHWAALGRPFYALGTAAGLRSWSGSMFEYLMPSLVLAEPPGSALCEANGTAVREQMAYGLLHGVPWGLSECAHAGRDHTLAYQYAPQGVPRLALRRTPRDERVVAPYATVLALGLAPRAACANLHRLTALQARGVYGFIEAMDYSPAHRTAADAATPVLTYMAHHQGMSLVALANLLLDGVAQRWGMANPAMQAVASLLHERAPRDISMRYAPPLGPPADALHRHAPSPLRHLDPGANAVPPTQVLSNGHYSVALRPSGAGWSRRGAVDLTRWRDDALRDEAGSFFFLRRAPGLPLVSLTQHPAPDAAAQYRSSFHVDRVVFEAEWIDLHSRCTVWVSPEDDIEFRQVVLFNSGDRPLTLALHSALEPCLSESRADEAHPAFANLFVQARWQPAQQALVMQRKPRLPNEAALQMAHFLAASDPPVAALQVQTDRQRWRGRNRAASQPLGLLDDLPADAVTLDAGAMPAAGSVETGPFDPRHDATLPTGLDPMCVIATTVHLPPGGRVCLTFATAAAELDSTLRAVIDKYRQPGHVERALLMSATLAGIRLREQRLGAETVAALQTLSTALVLGLTRPEPVAAGPHGLSVDPADVPDDRRGDGADEWDATAACDRRLLWPLGLSGDRPLLLVMAGVPRGLSLLRTLAQALRQWDDCGIPCDLVVVNAEPTSYQAPVQTELAALSHRHDSDNRAATRRTCTQWVVLRADDVSEPLMATLKALARVELPADGRPLAHHVQAWADAHERDADRRHRTASTALRPAPAPREAPPVPEGRFDADSGDFRFEASAMMRPPRPWINVLAQDGFGALVSEAGGGFTWAGNSRLNQLTAWSNDPVADPPSEWFLVQDLDSREVWSVWPSAWGHPSARYQVVHGQGHSRIRHADDGLQITAEWCVDPVTALKQVHLHLHNSGRRHRQLRLVGLAEWLMGSQRADRHTVHTRRLRQRLALQAPDTGRGEPAERKLNMLLATQRECSGGFGGGTAFLALVDDALADEDWTCDRRECFDDRGQMVVPDHYGQRAGAGLDPCAALACRLDLPGGASAGRTYLLGWAASPEAARELAIRSATVPPAQRLAESREAWDHLLGATTVTTPDPLFNAMVNRWLLYQTVSCRLWAKAGFYQAGGATGFRDQLQDALALAWARPELLRAQILRCAARQFEAGDVQHWWHEPTGAGVRTHFSDDLLWLAWAVVHHQRCTGDATLLDEAVPFLLGGEIPEGAEDLYETPRIGGQAASVYEHAARAVDHSLRVGAHGLPLMGSGDWNDGMNTVGAEGRGESVWLGWFLCRLMADMVPLARSRGEVARAERWTTAAQGWTAALLGPAWDGLWFKRAFFDDGTPLGSQANAEARIDLIAQAWAVLSGVAPLGMQHLALASVHSHLLDEDAGLIRLLTPPLADARPSAGYIQAYPPGVRENGGQYTHAGVWLLMAQAELARHHAPGQSDGDLAYRHFTWLSPAHRSAHPARGPVYGLEPYAVAGDVYSQPPHVGRGGWSWYTGAAAWLHRAAIESIFGLQLSARELRFEPGLPSHWPRAELVLQRDGRRMRFLLWRGVTLAELMAQVPADTQVLWPGVPLAWQNLPAQSCHLVPLLNRSAGAPA